MKFLLHSLVFISVILFSQCFVTHPRDKCQEILNLLNVQAVLSFGKACLQYTNENDPNNVTRCAALAYLNLACKTKPEAIYKMEVSLDDSKKEAREKKNGQGNTILALLLYNDLVEKSFLSEQGENLTNLLIYSVMKRNEQIPLNGQMKTISCNQSGTADVFALNADYIINFHNCQHLSNSVGSDYSNLTWNGRFTGILTYTGNSAANYFLDDVFMSGTLQYSGDIRDRLFGSRSINENCSVEVNYIFPRGSYIFCGKSNRL